MIIKIQLPNIKYGQLIPSEDAVAAHHHIFCVADGITRDPKLPKDFPKDSRNIRKILKYYPNPSGAKAVADIFCKNFIRLGRNTNDIKKIFIKINGLIRNYNRKKIKNVDYLVNDYFGCVASGGLIKYDVLYYGYICDGGLAIFDKNGRLKFQTEDDMKKFTDFEKKHLKTKNLNYSLPAYRYLIRTKHRNRPNKIFNSRLVSYGALTGEKSAEPFIGQGKIKLTKGDLLVFYSDGFIETLKNRNFFAKIYQKNSKLMPKKLVSFSKRLALKNYEKYGKERSLVATIFLPANKPPQIKKG
ncbi:MAG: hypothetical protein WC528_01900 [Patescibacteria group bacterium]